MVLLRRSPYGLGVAVCLFLFFSRARATDWPPISPDDLHMTQLREQPGAPAVILLREEIADDPHNNHSTYMRIKVLTEAGRRYADVEVPYSHRHFSITNVSGRTIHPDGSIVPFQGQVFDKVALHHREGPHSGEIRYNVKSFTLPDVQVGSIIEYRYSLRYDDNLFVPPEWLVQDDLFQRQAHFKFIPYEGELQLAHGRIGNGVAWTSFLPNGVQPQHHEVPRSSLASSRTASDSIELQMTNVAPVVHEPFMMPVEEMRYRVRFYYMVDANQQDFWKAEGKFLSKDAESFIGKNNGLDQALILATSGANNPEQKVRSIYKFVSQFENWSYNPPRASQEDKVLGIKANHDVEEVLGQHGGTHDDLTRLFVAMVRAAGIPASLMWVPSRDQTFFDPALLSTSQLSAEIAIVSLNGKDVFLDPGSKFCQYGLLDWRYSNDRGIRESDKGTVTAETPLPDYNHAMIQRLARLSLTQNGKFEGIIRIAFYGFEAMELRQQGGRTDEQGRKKLLEDAVRRWLPADSEVTLTSSPAWTNPDVQLGADFKVSGPLAVGAGKRWIVPVHIFQVNQHPRFAASQRINPIYFYYLTRQTDEVHIALPVDLQVESVPPADNVRLDYALYATDQKQEGPNGIVARRDLVIGGMAFPSKMYSEIKTFFDRVKAGDDQEAVVKGAMHAEVR
jgi:hypothetical protein